MHLAAPLAIRRWLSAKARMARGPDSVPGGIFTVDYVQSERCRAEGLSAAGRANARPPVCVECSRARFADLKATGLARSFEPSIP